MSLEFATPISPPSLQQLAAKIVVLMELPTSDLPKVLKEDFQALAHLPGNFTVIETSKKFTGLDGKKLTTAQLKKFGPRFQVPDIGSPVTVSLTMYGINRVWAARGPSISATILLDPRLMYTLEGHAVVTVVDGRELKTVHRDHEWEGVKEMDSLTMVDKDTVVIKVVFEDPRRGMKIVMTAVAQRE